jgi:glycosyltransferase involved in cell wall biosynthesis
LRIVVSHPGVGLFVQQTVRAFYDADVLDRFYTTFALLHGQGIGRFLYRNYGRSVSSLQKKAIIKLSNRLVENIPAPYIHTFPLFEMVRIVAGRSSSWQAADAIWEWAEKRFDRFVSEKLVDNDAVYGFEHAVLETFKSAKIKKIKTVYEMPAPHHETTTRILNAEYERFPELGGYQKYLAENKTRKRNQRREEELDLADVIVCNSDVTRDSLLNAGVEASKIIKVPLGMPYMSSVPKNQASRDKFKVLYAGTISLLKGVHYLLDAWRTLSPRKDVELHLVGKLDLPAALFENASNIFLHEPISRSELREYYRKSTLVVLPTLLDGFGMVVSEALAEGIPVLTTPRAGSAEFIKDRFNGFIVPPCDSEAIAQVLEWCAENKSEVLGMRNACIKTARSWQWEDYRNSISKAVISRLESVAC